jgi:hypothetical protein
VALIIPSGLSWASIIMGDLFDLLFFATDSCCVNLCCFKVLIHMESKIQKKRAAESVFNITGIAIQRFSVSVFFFCLCGFCFVVVPLQINRVQNF